MIRKLLLLLLAALLTHCGAQNSAQLSEKSATEQPERVAFKHLQFLIDPIYQLSEDTIPLKQANGEVLPTEVKLAPITLQEIEYCQGKCRTEGDPSPMLDQGMAPFSPNQLTFQSGSEEIEATSFIMVDLHPAENIDENEKAFALYANTPKSQVNFTTEGADLGTYLGKVKKWRGDGTNWILSSEIYHPVIQQLVGKDWQDFVYKTPGFYDQPIDFSGKAYRIFLRKNSQ